MKPALLSVVVFSLAAMGAAKAQEASPRAAETFEVAGHKAFLYAAPQPVAGRPWVW
jgi:hypothetical protein